MAKSIYFAIDGDYYEKSKVNEAYKRNRKKSSFFSPEVEIIVQIILTLSEYYTIMNKEIEADDVSYSFCKANNNCICISDDKDWLLNLTANDNVSLFRNKLLVTKDNFEYILKFPLDKIKLYMFLSGDSKDKVLKPFRLKGSILENIDLYKNVEDYITKNCITRESINEYLYLIFPVLGKQINILKGKLSDKTEKFIKKYHLDFYNDKLVNELQLL